MANLITQPLGEAGGGAMDLDALTSSVSERVDPLAFTRQIGRATDTSLAERGLYDPETGTQLQAPEPFLNKDAMTQKWGVKGPTPELSLSFTSDLPESVAISMNGAKRDEIARAYAQSRSPGGVGSYLADLGYGFLDPIGLAASALPVFGEARIAGVLGRVGLDLGEGLAGRVALRAATGAADATAANAPLVALRYGLSQQEHADYSMADAGRDLAYGAVLGSVLHPAIGAVHDAFTAAVHAMKAPAALDADPELSAAAMHTATAATLEDRPVDVTGFADLAHARAEREDLWYKLSLDNEDLQREIGGVSDAMPPDPATDARLQTVRGELADPALPAARRDDLASELAMLTEGAPADASAADLYAARSQAQRQGLQAALDRNTARIQQIEASLHDSDAARHALGAPRPDDAIAMDRATEAAKAAPVPAAALSPELAAHLADAEALVGHARAAGLLGTDEEAELAKLDEARGKAGGTQRAAEAAAACVARGMA